MTEPRSLGWRDSPLVIAVDYLRSMPPAALIVASLWGFGPRSVPLIDSVLTAVAALYLAVATVEPVFRWWTHHYVATNSCLRHRMGLIERRHRDFPWAGVAAVTVDQPFLHRIFGLSRLTLTQAGDEAARVTLRGANREVVDLILARVEIPTAAEGGAVRHAPTTQPQPGRPIHRASAGELVVMSFTQGQVIVLAGVGISIGWDALQTFGLFESLGRTAGRVPLWVLIVVGTFLAMLIGVAATVVRYNRFQVWEHSNREVEITYGLLNLQRRRIAPAAVQGIVIHRNLIEMLLSRARLGLLTTDSSRQLRSNLLLPSLPADKVRAIALAHFSDIVPEHSILNLPPRPGRSALTTLTPVVIAAGGGAALLLLTSTPGGSACWRHSQSGGDAKPLARPAGPGSPTITTDGGCKSAAASVRSE